MAGLHATETGNELSQPRFQFTSLVFVGHGDSPRHDSKERLMRSNDNSFLYCQKSVHLNITPKLELQLRNVLFMKNTQLKSWIGLNEEERREEMNLRWMPKDAENERPSSLSPVFFALEPTAGINQF